MVVLNARFYVDSIPIRVYANKTGVPYPSTGHMYVDSTLYDGSNWATNGGLTKVNWTYSPFIASYRSFFIDGCVWDNTTGLPLCAMMQPTLWWDAQNYQKLSPADQNLLELARSYSLFYDYCNDTTRYPIRPPECSWNLHTASLFRCMFEHKINSCYGTSYRVCCCFPAAPTLK